MDDKIDGLVQECSNSIANALELLQSCTKPPKWRMKNKYIHIEICDVITHPYPNVSGWLAKTWLIWKYNYLLQKYIGYLYLCMS